MIREVSKRVQGILLIGVFQVIHGWVVLSVLSVVSGLLDQGYQCWV